MLTACAGDPPAQPTTVVNVTNPATSAAPPIAATAQPTATPPAPAAPLISDSQPPAGFDWVDKKGDFRLAAKKDEPGACEIWNLATQKKVGQVDGIGSVGGGADPACAQLSPAATLVQIGNGRGMVWKNWSNQITQCLGNVVAPDDSSCIEDDRSQFYFQEKNGPAANLDVMLSTPKSAPKKVTTIPRGLNRDGNSTKWWTTRYCDATRALIDIKGGALIVVDPIKGTAYPTKRGNAPCP